MNQIDFSFHNDQNIFDENDYLKNIYFTDSSFRKISKKLILNVIKARLDEIINIVKKQLTVPGFDLNLSTKILVIGESSNFRSG